MFALGATRLEFQRSEIFSRFDIASNFPNNAAFPPSFDDRFGSSRDFHARQTGKNTANPHMIFRKLIQTNLRRLLNPLFDAMVINGLSSRHYYIMNILLRRNLQSGQKRSRGSLPMSIT